MIARFRIPLGAFALAVGIAGPPLEPLRVLAALAICAVTAANRRFIAALSLVAIALGGWLQHGQLRLALLAAAVLYAVAIRVTAGLPRASTMLMAIALATGVLWLLLG